MTIIEKIAENAKNSNIQPATSFSKSMPPQFDADGLLQLGDKIVMPTTMPQIYQQKFGTNVGEFIVVELVKANGTKTAFNLFPPMFSRTIFPAEMVDGVAKLKLPVRHPKGGVVDHYLSFRGKGTNEKTDVQMAIESMLGWTIEVKGDEPVKTQKWVNGVATNDLKDSHVFTFEKV